MRLAFFGLPLAALLLQQDGHDVVFAALSPVSAPGKRRLTRQLGASRILHVTGNPAWQTQAQSALTQLKPDLLVSWFWTRRLPEQWLQVPRLAAIGAHPSLLPRHRGPNPYFAAIDAGDAVTGVSVHLLTAAYDEGDVLATATLTIGERNAWQLARALDRPSLALLRQVVRAYAAGTPPERQPQLEALSSWAPEPEDALLRADLSWPSARWLRRIRALAPAPGLTLELEDLLLTIVAARPAQTPLRALHAGQAAVWGDPPALFLGTSDGTLELRAASVELASSEHAEPAPVLRGAELARWVQLHLPAVRS